MSIYKQLNHDPLLKYLNKNEIEKIKSIIKTEEYDPDETIITLGDRNRDIMIIEQGITGVYILNTEDEEIKVAELPEGEIIGDQNFVIPVRRSANVRALGKVNITRYKYHKLIDLLQKEPLIAAKLFTAINNSLSEKLLRTIGKYLEK